jgi:hypothetical protein
VRSTPNCYDARIDPVAAQKSIEVPNYFNLNNSPQAAKDLKRLSTVCKGMRSLMMPILFRHVRLFVYSFTRAGRKWARHSLQLMEERLKFWKSVQIVPLVQSCEIVRQVSCIVYQRRSQCNYLPSLNCFISNAFFVPKAELCLRLRRIHLT